MISANGLERAPEILLVEDNDGDARLTQEALKGGLFRCILHRVKDGVEALEFVRREGKFASVPRPDFVLLDLNLPRVDGREVLGEMKRDPALRRIPVLVLTTSAAESDVDRAYDSYANTYITKPVTMDDFIQVVNVIQEFWLRVATLPSGQ
jgi:two-component system, chemotaxis family, response regulator Rcp1